MEGMWGGLGGRVPGEEGVGGVADDSSACFGGGGVVGNRLSSGPMWVLGRSDPRGLGWLVRLA